MPTFDTSMGATLSYETIGDGPPVVCIPGGPGFAARQLGDLAGLGDHRRLIILNTRGTGDSSPPDDGSYALGNHAHDVEELRLHLEMERMDLFGHSHGALIATWYASEYPDRVERLVLDSPPMPGSPVPEDIQEMFVRWDDKVQAFVETMEQHEPAAEFFFGNEWASLDVVSRLASIKAPTLFIFGAGDPITEPIIEAATSALLSAKLVRLPEAGHFTWVENPDDHRAAVLGFLDAS